MGAGSVITILLGVLVLLLCATLAALAGLALLLQRERRRRGAAEQEARAHQARYRLVADHASDIIMHVGASGEGRYVSPSARNLLGFSPEELRGWSWVAKVHPDDRPALQAALNALRDGAEQKTVEYRCVCKNGSEVWLEAHIRKVHDPDSDAPDGLLINARDITRRKQAEDKLAEVASTDSLTGLANRRRFDEILDREWRRAVREEQPISLLLIDADHFKSYNDHYGHPLGDKLLRTIANCIATATRRPGDLASRYGGEEFAVLLPTTEAQGAANLAEQIRRAVFTLGVPHGGNGPGVATVSIGAACLLPRPETGQAALVRAADEALYAAKRNGRNRVEAAGVTGFPV